MNVVVQAFERPKIVAVIYIHSIGEGCIIWLVRDELIGLIVQGLGLAGEDLIHKVGSGIPTATRLADSLGELVDLHGIRAD